LLLILTTHRMKVKEETMRNREVFNITWGGIEIEIGYIPSYCEAYKKYQGVDLSHIEVRSIKPRNVPIPITETGYRSMWVRAPQLAEHGGAVEYVTAFLDEEAKGKDWKETQEASRQYQLF